MIDIIEIQENLKFVKHLQIKFRFKGLDYLVSDKYGNFFALPHCPDKRTIPFKQLKKNQNYIYYHGSKKYFPELRKKRVVVNERYLIPIN